MGTLTSKRLSNFIFAGLFGLALILFYRILLPFFMPVLLGAFLVVLFMPVQDFLCSKLKGRASLCAGLATTAVVLVILVPLTVLGYLVTREVLAVMAAAQGVLDRIDLRDELLAQVPSGLRKYVQADPHGHGMEKAVMDAVAGGAGLLSNVLSAGTELVIDLFLMILAMYYFFLDGRRILAESVRLVPLDPRYAQAFIKEFKDVAYAIIYGNTLTAVLQGLTCFVGMLIAGVPNAALWSAATVVMAFIPIGGTALVWGPIGVVLIATHHYSQGLFMLAWGALLVSAADNMLRPKLCGAKMELHPLLVFLSMFGGLAVFGMMGILVGPLIASLFMAMVRIYRRDFLGLPALVREPSPPARPAPAEEPAPVLPARALEAAGTQ